MTNYINLFFHLTELKYRITYVLLGYILTIFVSYYYSEQIIYLLTRPLLNISVNYKFIFTNIIEFFSSCLTSAIWISSLIYFNIILYQVWLFLTPGLYKKEYFIYNNILIKFIITGIFSLIFSYFFILPIFFKFFTSFELINNNSLLQVTLDAKISEYIFIVIKVFTIAIISLNLPLYIFILTELKIISVKKLIIYRNIFYLLVFLFAAFITPPDLISQLIVAFPIILIYESTIFLFLIKK